MRAAASSTAELSASSSIDASCYLTNACLASHINDHIIVLKDVRSHSWQTSSRAASSPRRYLRLSASASSRILNDECSRNGFAIYTIRSSFSYACSHGTALHETAFEYIRGKAHGRLHCSSIIEKIKTTNRRRRHASLSSSSAHGVCGSQGVKRSGGPEETPNGFYRYLKVPSKSENTVLKN